MSVTVTQAMKCYYRAPTVKLFTLQDRDTWKFSICTIVSCLLKKCLCLHNGFLRHSTTKSMLSIHPGHDIALWDLGTDQEPVQLCQYSYFGTIGHWGPDRSFVIGDCLEHGVMVSTPPPSTLSSRSTSLPSCDNQKWVHILPHILCLFGKQNNPALCVGVLPESK